MIDLPAQDLIMFECEVEETNFLIVGCAFSHTFFTVDRMLHEISFECLVVAHIQNTQELVEYVIGDEWI
jgi:hypothetical protein